MLAEKGTDWIKTCHCDRSICLGKGELPTWADLTCQAFSDQAEELGKPMAFHQMWLSAFGKGLEFNPSTYEYTPMDAPLIDEDVSTFVDAGGSHHGNLGRLPGHLLVRAYCRGLQ
ncbi:MAG: hypothetical protein SWK76_07555 [Actinomycetota bacterium]|nr:hypothetical protein [Actinomycetota bacterium]